VKRFAIDPDSPWNELESPRNTYFGDFHSYYKNEKCFSKNPKRFCHRVWQRFWWSYWESETFLSSKRGPNNLQLCMHAVLHQRNWISTVWLIWLPHVMFIYQDGDRRHQDPARAGEWRRSQGPLVSFAGVTTISLYRGAAVKRLWRAPVHIHATAPVAALRWHMRAGWKDHSLRWHLASCICWPIRCILQVPGLPLHSSPATGTTISNK